MASADHRIRRQLWQVRARTKAEAFALRQQLRDAWADTLAPVFERAFDARAGGDEVVRLPRLHLHVRLAPGEDPVARLPELVARALEEQWPETDTPAGDAARGRRPDAGAPRTPGRDRKRATSGLAASARDDLLVYLESGHLPWHLAGQPASETRAQLATLAERERDAILTRWSDRQPAAAALARLLQLTPIAAWPELARAFIARRAPAGAEGAAANAAVDEAIAAGATPLKVARLLLTAYELTRTEAAVSPDRPAPAPRSRSKHPAPRSRVEGPRRARRAGPPASDSSSPERDEPLPSPDLEHEREAASTRETDPDSPHAQHVPHAGLVLLHPFLPQFFAATGVLADPSARPGTDALPRAAALLHLLATGADTPACDFELPVIRVLLGLAPDDPLQADAPCSPQDRAEADALLQSVIAHWSALRSTSPGGLRTTFLQRSGLLRAIDGAWLLQLERGPFDVLLDRLPWALGVIKLPWMPRPLHTEW